MLPRPAPHPSSADDAFDEVHHAGAAVRPHYRPLWERIGPMGRGGLAATAWAARRAAMAIEARHAGSTGAGDTAGRPFDVVPRILTAAEWATLAAGIRQRARALACFVEDVYGAQRAVHDGVVPAQLLQRTHGFRPELVGAVPPGGRAHVGAVDVVRDVRGRWIVVGDDLDTPSGAAAMLANRAVTRRVLPDVFAACRVRGVEHYPQLLLRALRRLAPRGAERAVVVVLTPGRYDAAWAEHVALAAAMGVELAELGDLAVVDRVVHLKTTRGLQRVDVLYGRAADAAVVDAWRAGSVAVADPPGSAVAADPALAGYVARLIAYYLAETPLLDDLPTWHLGDAEQRRWALAHLDDVMVMPLGAPGRGMLLGPYATGAQRAEVARAILERPRQWLARPVTRPSRHPCCVDGKLAPRYVDLRAFVVCGEEPEVVPGGLTRIAPSPAALALDPWRGGSKDTWVLAD